MRIDKYLKNSRLIKRRTVAKEACEQGRVGLNGRPAKPGSEVDIGDEIAITFGGNTLKIKVLEMIEGSRKEDAARMYEVVE